MKCTNCGHELAENTLFCGACGQRCEQAPQPFLPPENTAGASTAAQTPTVKKEKSTNTLMLVLAGLGTGIGYILSLVIVSIVCSMLHNSIEVVSLASVQMVSNLSGVLSFFITAIIILIGGAISCKKTNDLLKFFACCISGKAIAAFVESAIITVLTAVSYWKGTDISAVYYPITFGVEIFCAVISAVLAAFILRCIILQEVSSADCTDRNTQEEAALLSDGDVPPQKSPKSKGAAIVLCIFLGSLGIHRFYTEKVGTGLLWLLTGGLFGIGVIVDFFMLLFGAFKDAEGRKL